LLTRATTGTRKGSYGVAGDILAEWHDWSEADLPQLKKALTLYPGSMIAHILGEIGTPAAIQILVDDLKSPTGAASQTGWVLKELGPKVLPYLLPLLASEDEHTWRTAGTVITEMGAPAAVYALEWADIATNETLNVPERLATVRGLGAMGIHAKEVAKRIRQLLAYGPGSIFREPLFAALKAMRDPIVLSQLARGCLPSADILNRSWERNMCIDDMASFGRDARSFGPLFVKFLMAEGPEDQIAGMNAIAQSHYTEATPLIEPKLSSVDWRVTYEAIYALNELEDLAAEPRIAQLASTHWLPELRQFATAVSAGLKSAAHRYIAPRDDGVYLLLIDGMLHDPHFDEKACPSNHWTWAGKSFATPPEENRGQQRRKIGETTLIGSNRGEWGGGLYAETDGILTQVILEDNVVAIEPVDTRSAIVLFGLWHGAVAFGVATLAERHDDGAWTLTPVARMPLDAEALRKLGPDLFAAWSGGRVVVFTTKGILGVADCAA
jgi:HEAT repeat protein